MALISLDHVSKVYPKGTRPALDDVTVHVDRGDFVFLVGASGSGKTTLLSLLLHEEEATDGEIRVAGNDLRRLANSQVPQYRRSIGFVFQDYKLLNNKTVWQNVAFALEVIGTSRSTISSLVPKVLETVGLVGKESNYPHELSGGEAQRVAIARAYVNHPQILLADEPTGNLDPTTSLGIMEVLEAINRTGTTIVMATHNEEIVNSMRKRVVELHNGKIVRDQEHGSYDSALFFPDSETESKSKAQQVVATSTATVTGVGAIEAVEAASNMPEHDASTFQAMNAVVEAMHDDSEDDGGIARLAKSVHSGRKGRYGETFKSVETTMTWGRGLDVGEIAAQGDVDVPPAQGDDAQNQIDAHVPPAQKHDAPENGTPEQGEQQSQGEQQGADSMPPVPPAPPTPSAQQTHDSAQSGDAESAQVDGADAATDDGDAAPEHAETENAAPLNAVPRNADAADGSEQETETIHHEEQ